VPILDSAMIIRKYFFAAVLFLFIANTNASTLSPIKDTPNSVRQAVEAYCKVESDGYWMFNGLMDMMMRHQVVKYSTKRKEKLKSDTWNNPFSVNVDVYPIRLDYSYKIDDIQVSGPKATAKVIYRYAMLTEDKADKTRRVIDDHNNQDTVTFNLVFEDNHWWVFDPPPPRLSKDGLVNYNGELIYELGTKENPKWQIEIDTIRNYWKLVGEK
jgi:hypothetical protein